MSVTLETYSLAATLPPSPHEEIVRDSIVATIVGQFEAGTNIIFLNGGEGSGKTICLRQVYNSLSPHSFGYFIISSSRWEYDPNAIYLDLLNQYSLFLDGRDLTPEEIEEPPPPTRYSLRLTKAARKRRYPFYFIIDGLELIPECDSASRLAIFDLLPLYSPQFRFLFSGSLSKFSEIKKSHAKEMPVPPFGIEETRRYLSRFILPSETVEHIHKLCHGNPAQLSAFRRKFETEPTRIEDIESLLGQPSLLELDWEPIAGFDELQKDIVAFIAFSQIAPTYHLIAQILDASLDAIQAVIESVSFLIENEHSQIIGFTSEGHRAHARNKLQSRKEDISRRTIEKLLARPESKDSLLSLPEYLYNSGDGKDLFEYLTPEHVGMVVESAKSWRTARKHTHLAFEKAKTLNLNAEMFKFGIEESTLIALEEAQSWRAAIDAHVAVEDFPGALELTSTVVSHEDRLHLLCIIARAQRRQGKTIDQDLKNEALRLIELIDLPSLGKRSIDIVADLIYVDQDTAIEIVKNAIKDEKVAASSRESLAKLTLGAFDLSTESGSSSDALKNLVERLNDPAIKGFSSTVSLVFGNSTAAAVISSLNSLEEVDNEIPIIRLWCQENAKRDDAIEVVSEALDRAIKATSYTPTALDFRELAFPLRFCRDLAAAEELVNRFAGQGEILKKIGPTEEYVHFETSLSIAESRYAPEKASDRLFNALFYSTTIQDVSIQGSCIARIYSTATEDNNLPTSDRHALIEESGRALAKCVCSIESGSARHFQNMRGIISCLSKKCFSEALQYAGRLNTLARREAAILVAISEKADAGFEYDEVLLAVSKALSINDEDHKSSAVSAIVNWLISDECEILLFRRIKQVVLDAVLQLPAIEDRLRCCCFLLTKMCTAGAIFAETETSDLTNRIRTEWKDADASWAKVALGYNVAVSFSEHSKPLALSMLKEIKEIQSGSAITCSVAASTMLSCIRIAISAFRGVIRFESESRSREAAIRYLIDRVPSSGFQAKLYADLALTYVLAGHQEDCARIVTDYLNPCLTSISDLDAGFAAEISDYCLPANYAAFNLQAVDELRKLNGTRKNQAASKILRFLLDRCLPSEPFDRTPPVNFRLQYRSIRAVLEILEQVDNDTLISQTIEGIVDTILAEQKQGNVSQQQKADIAAALLKIVDRTLPDKNGITHEGYKIVCEVNIARLSNSNQSKWTEWIDRARSLPNVADSALVLTILAPLVPNNFTMTRDSIMREALEKIFGIPTLIDKIEHFEAAAEKCLSFDRSLAKECISQAIQSSLQTKPDEAASFQRSIVDLAYRIDANFASKIASEIDCDPSKMKSKMHFQKCIDDNAHRIEMANGKILMPESEVDISRVLRNARNLHGQLNANKVASLAFERLIAPLQMTTKLPINKSLPILLWITANLNKKYETSAHAAKFLCPIFDSAILAAELSARVAFANKTVVSKIKISEPTLKRNSLIVKPGERDKAKAFVKEWMEENARTFLWIMDPYFSHEDLPWILDIRNIHADIPIEVFCGAKNNRQHLGSNRYEDVFRNHWTTNISSQSPGETLINVIGARETHDVPFHDRYIFTDDSGLRIGTSFNSIGISKISEISCIYDDQLDCAREEIETYRRRSNREHRGKPITYSVFNL